MQDNENKLPFSWEVVSRKRCGEWLRLWRKQMRESAESLARRAGWSGALVRYIELGDRSAPGVEDLDTLVRALQVPHDAVGRMAAALARETLWWHWTARDKNTGQRIAELLGVKEPANIPRPDLIDKLCELVSGMRLGEDGIILETRDGESMRLFDKPEIQL